MRGGVRSTCNEHTCTYTCTCTVYTCTCRCKAGNKHTGTVHVHVHDQSRTCTCICRLNRGKQSPKADSEKNTELPRTCTFPLFSMLQYVYMYRFYFPKP